MTLGEKIRTLRKEKKLTQAQLAGKKITRNMVCEIERGDAVPSFQTLLYLAEELGVPAAYLVAKEGTPDDYRKPAVMPRILAFYRGGNYAECLRLAGKFSAPDDELALLLANCSLASGCAAFHAGNMKTALTYLRAAENYAKKTVYPTGHIRVQAMLYAAIAENVCAPRRDFSEESYEALAGENTAAELHAYMTDREDYPYRNSFFRRHQEARELMHQNRNNKALPILTGLENEKGDPAVSAYFLFRLYSDMENCYRELGDFEKAYKYSSKRMTLLNAFQS